MPYSGGMQSNGNAFHENAAAFGPCAGPATDNTPEGDVSWACMGYGTERIDPESWELKTIIVCGRCHSLRAGRVIQSMMESAA
jgi:hypothetical protein